MKEENYEKNKNNIVRFLKSQSNFCFKITIIHGCVIPFGMKKTSVSLTLREMRKRKEVKYYRRRWGL